jgi:hypothetical protein
MGFLKMATKKLSDFLKDVINHSPLKADKPYIPQPPEQQQLEQPASNNSEPFYSEDNRDIETIEGTNLSFGYSEQMIVNQNTSSSRTSKKTGYILGSGRLVTSLNPTKETGIEKPGVGGICFKCNEEAAALYQTGLISFEEMQRCSLFDTTSAAQCQACGRNVCIKHCRPFEDSNGNIANLCPECTEEAQHKKFFEKALKFLLMPFKSRTKTPSANPKGEKHYENTK